MRRCQLYSILIIASIASSSICGVVDDLALKISSSLSQAKYHLQTSDTHKSMDCLKVSQKHEGKPFGIFHSSTSHYSELYYAQMNATDQWQNSKRISDRGSQGSVKMITIKGVDMGFLVGYQLEDDNGNTIAIRYYQSQDKIKHDQYLYQYQLERKVSGNGVQNVGTVNFDEVLLNHPNDDHRFNQYHVGIRFHYSPDGQHDLPGYGYVTLKPLRDFVDGEGRWVGGAKAHYEDWVGYSDKTVESLFRYIGCQGKIGQRDDFEVAGMKFYLYQCNIDGNFDWKSWRIILYSEQLRTAKFLPLNIGGATDIANPHITLTQKIGNSYEFVMTFFLPSQGITPGIQARDREVIVKTRFTYP